MALPQYEGSTGYVRALDDHVVGGADAVKLAMDKFGDEYKSWFNTTFLDALKAATINNSGGDNIGVTPILTGADTVQKALAALLTQVQAGTLGQIPDGTITDVKLSNTVGQIKDVVTSHSADYTLQVPYGGTTTGTENTYAIETPITALVIGMAVSVKFNLDSTGASTLNWNGKGAKGIKKATGADATALKATGIYTLRYDGINFILQGEGGSGNATASDLTLGKTASTDAGDIVGTGVNAKRVANGSGTATGTTFTVSGLGFTPSKVIASLFRSGVSVNQAIMSTNFDFYSNSSNIATKSKVVVASDAATVVVVYGDGTYAMVSDGFTVGQTESGAVISWWAFE